MRPRRWFVKTIQTYANENQKSADPLAIAEWILEENHRR